MPFYLVAYTTTRSTKINPRSTVPTVTPTLQQRKLAGRHWLSTGRHQRDPRRDQQGRDYRNREIEHQPHRDREGVADEREDGLHPYGLSKLQHQPSPSQTEQPPSSSAVGEVCRSRHSAVGSAITARPGAIAPFTRQSVAAAGSGARRPIGKGRRAPPGQPPRSPALPEGRCCPGCRAPHAQVLLEDWLCDYNTHRPHTSFNGLTPSKFATCCPSRGRP